MNSIPASLLSFEHVTVMRGDRVALHDINLEIACGEHVCILGPNGGGKSTLIKTITRECYPLYFHTGARAMGYFRTALHARNRIA